jgi:hypothetical protein
VPRDLQKQKTYDAEYIAFLDTAFEVPVGLWALEQVANAVYESEWWADLRPRAVRATIVEASPHAGRSKAVLAKGEIRISHNMDTIATLCHEFAHFVGSAQHDDAFRAAEVELVRLCGGDAPAERLAACYSRVALGVGTIAPAPHGILGEITGGLASFALDTARPQETKHVRRVLALLAKAQSTSPEESEALRAKALELSSRHGISSAHLEAQRSATEADLIERKIRIGAGPYVRPRYRLLRVIAHGHCCDVFYNTDRAGRVATVLGHRSDVVEVEMLYVALDHQARVEVMRAPASGNVIRFRRSWLTGFVAAVGATISKEEKAATEGDKPEAVSTSLVLKERRERARDFKNLKYPNIRPNHKRTVVEEHAYAEGRAAGSLATVRRRGALSPGRLALNS